MIREFLLTLVFCCAVGSIEAQVDIKFYDYLDERQLKREQEIYINKFSNSISLDTLSYLKARFYCQYYNDSLFFDSYKKSKNLFLNDTIAFKKAAIQFLKSTPVQQQKWFNSIDSNNVYFFSGQIKKVYQASISPLSVDVNELPAALHTDFLNYKSV